VECLPWGLGNATDLEHHNLRHCFCEKSHVMTRGNVLRSVQTSKYTRLLVNRATMMWVWCPMPYLLSLCWCLWMRVVTCGFVCRSSTLMTRSAHSYRLAALFRCSGNSQDFRSNSHYLLQLLNYGYLLNLPSHIEMG